MRRLTCHLAGTLTNPRYSHDGQHSRQADTAAG